jgi:uncharacterized OsmC-like protein
MKISASIKSSFNEQEMVVQTPESSKEIQIGTKSSGFGSSVNGNELLLLSIATSFSNDIYREAAKRNIDISGVEVECTGTFDGNGEPGKNFTYTAKVISDAPAAKIEELIQHTDKMAEVHNTLRKGLPVTLTT